MEQVGCVFSGIPAWLEYFLSAAPVRWMSSFSRSEPSETGRISAADREQINAQAERLLEQHGNHVLRLAYSYLHNMADAEEILQESLIQFLKTAPRLENERH